MSARAPTNAAMARSCRSTQHSADSLARNIRPISRVVPGFTGSPDVVTRCWRRGGEIALGLPDVRRPDGDWLAGRTEDGANAGPALHRRGYCARLHARQRLPALARTTSHSYRHLICGVDRHRRGRNVCLWHPVLRRRRQSGALPRRGPHTRRCRHSEADALSEQPGAPTAATVWLTCPWSPPEDSPSIPRLGSSPPVQNAAPRRTSCTNHTFGGQYNYRLCQELPPCGRSSAP